MMVSGVKTRVSRQVAPTTLGLTLRLSLGGLSFSLLQGWPLWAVGAATVLAWQFDHAVLLPGERCRSGSWSFFPQDPAGILGLHPDWARTGPALELAKPAGLNERAMQDLERGLRQGLYVLRTCRQFANPLLPCRLPIGCSVADMPSGFKVSRNS